MEEVIANVELSSLEISELANEALGSQPLRERVRSGTAHDKILSEVASRLRTGWKNDDLKDPHLRPFAQSSQSVCATDGILLMDDRVVVPQALQPVILKQLHKAHPGIRRMKSLARQHFYCPKMPDDIEKVAEFCNHCAQNADSSRKIPLQPWPNAGEHWARIHLDLAEPQKGNAFLVIADGFSKYTDAAWLKPATSTALLNYLRTVFRHSGPPETMVSDNGGQFTSVEFAELCNEFDIVHLRCAPRMPQSNGFAEKMVHTLKNAIDSNPRSLDTAVRAYNYTPNSAIDNKTPAEVFFGRPTRLPFDIHRSTSRPEPTKAQRTMKSQFDIHHGVAERDLTEEETVTTELWNNQRVAATVRKLLGSAMVELDYQGEALIRHLNQIWKRQPETKPGPRDTNVAADLQQRPPPASPAPAPRLSLQRTCKHQLDYRALRTLRDSSQLLLRKGGIVGIRFGAKILFAHVLLERRHLGRRLAPRGSSLAPRV